MKTPADHALHHLPLRPVELEAMVSLSAGVRHGYRILREARERAEGTAISGLATLYRALHRLREAGLIETVHTADAEAADDRRRVFRLTDLGHAVLAAEVRRLARLLPGSPRAGRRRATEAP